MQLRARFRPHPRGFGFLTPVGDDGLTPTTVTLTATDGSDSMAPRARGDIDAPRARGDIDAPRARGDTEVDRVFVPPPATRSLLADDLVDAEVELDDKGASASEITLVARPRRMVVGTVASGPGRLVVEPEPSIGTGWVKLDDGPASRLPTSVGRQVVVLVGDGEDGEPRGRALVAGPHVAGSPQAVRAAAVVVALGRAAPGLVPGGPALAGLDPAETETTHTRVVGQLAGGGRGAAAGLDIDGPIAGGAAPWAERRDEPCVTIDDASTRDLDDAVGASWDGQPGSPVQLAVHIADVGRAVGIDSDADRYARTVASTAYLAVGDNAPMLDPGLAEDALSLLPGEDRWALSVRFAVATDGAIGEVEVEVAAIRSRAKLTYAALEPWLAGDLSEISALAGDEDPAAQQVLTAAFEAARRLGVERDARVTFEDLFEDAELTPAVIDGRLTTVPAEPHAAAYRLIERLMVAANESVAGWLVERKVPALYRAHTGLDHERLERLRAAVELVGGQVPSLQVGAGGIDEGEAPEAAMVTGELLAEIERLTADGRDDDRALLVAAATGSTARATYEPDPSAHTGLGAAAYCHFTSPIRRYADLVVHRQIRATLADEAPPATTEQLRALAGWLDARAGAINHLQARERGDLWARLLDRGFLSEAEPATVTGLTSNGLRIRLPRIGLNGFVTAERALGLPPRERGSLAIDEHGLTTTSGPWRVGTSVTVRFAGLDDSGRPNWRLGDMPTA